MRRINGFLCIDDCIKERSIYCNQYWVEIDGEEYYFKVINDFYTELICYHIAKFLGIDACFCDLAILNGKKGIISKSLRKEGVKLVSGFEILNQYLDDSDDFVKEMGYKKKDNSIEVKRASVINSLEMIWQALVFRYEERCDIEDIMHQFVKMFCLDIIINNWDRHSGNWMIEESVNGIRLVPLFDWNEALKKNFRKSQMSVSSNNLGLEGKDLFQNMLINFFDISAYEYFDMFVKMFNKVNDNFYDIIRIAERQIQAKIPLLDKLKLFINFSKINKYINEVIVSRENGRSR